MNAATADSLLQTFVSARNAAESDCALSDLIEIYAEPLAAKIIRSKTRGEAGRGNSAVDAEDIRGEVMLQLVGRLQRLRQENNVENNVENSVENGSAKQIESFESYVAVATYNACDRFLSRKRPNRRRLKNGLRYLLTHRAGFNCWQNNLQNWVGGLARWQFENAAQNGNAADAPQKLTQLRDDARAFARDRKTLTVWSDIKQGYELLTAIFDWTNAPVDLDLLTNVCAEWWNVTDETIEIDRDFGAHRDEKPAVVQLADARQNAAEQNEQRVYLQKLWHEILELPPRQRAAVLLNLRDEQNRGIIDLWLIVGVATIQKIASALEMTTEQFAALWNDLPLDDNQIAARLGLTRQQIINLRKSARERLARKMRSF